MKKSLTALLLLLSVCFVQAQTKVFKEVSEDIQSQVKPIYQDNALVGYVVFTQLEKASADSFNYKITLMDENLNDIGVVNFKEIKLVLYGVTFEQDVLCLAYFKSNFYFKEYKSKKEYRAAEENEKTAILTQFLSLDGKIIKSNTLNVQVKQSEFSGKMASRSYMGAGTLKSVHLRNIPGKGFALLYGDEQKNTLVAFNTAGNQIWTRPVKIFEGASLANMLTAGKYIYVLSKNRSNKSNGDMQLGGYEVLGFHTGDSSAPFKHTLKDKQGNSLSISAFSNDPVTGNLFISGGIIDPRKGNTYETPKHFARGTFAGLYSMTINGPKKSDISEVYSYWKDGSQSLFSEKGRNLENDTYCWFEGAFKDYQGNTYFYGTSFVKRVKVGSIVSSVILAPVLYGFLIAAFGYNKVKIDNTVLLKQNPKGVLSIEKSLEGNEGGFYPNKTGWMFDKRNYMTAANPETKNIYLIISDKSSFFIYSNNAKKIIRTIPRKEGNSFTYIYPAKEGHIMVSEYNRSQKSTTVSIEAL
jgi:hypothetical protein